MPSMHRTLAVVSPLLVVGCASTLSPGQATYMFDRRCLPASMELRRMPVSEFEKAASSKPRAAQGAASKLYSRIPVHTAEVLEVLPLLNRLATDGSAIAAAPVAAGNSLVVVTHNGGVYGFVPE